jgi:hypothetical protein
MGTRNIVAAIGVGDTREKMSMTFKIMVQLFMQQLMAEKERQEAVLNAVTVAIS